VGSDYTQPSTERREMNWRQRDDVRKAEYREHEAIDWSEPNEENGYYDQGRSGVAWWISARKSSAVDIAVEHLTLPDLPDYFPLPRKNPLPDRLSADQWREVRARIGEIHRDRATALLERGYEHAKFLEGKDLDSAKRNAERDRLEDYIASVRNLALIFHRLGEALKRERERRADNVVSASEAREGRHDR
jgi:hypothetical protein